MVSLSGYILLRSVIIIYLGASPQALQLIRARSHRKQADRFLSGETVAYFGQYTYLQIGQSTSSLRERLILLCGLVCQCNGILESWMYAAEITTKAEKWIEHLGSHIKERGFELANVDFTFALTRTKTVCIILLRH